jgi:hypothetical protein
MKSLTSKVDENKAFWCRRLQHLCCPPTEPTTSLRSFEARQCSHLQIFGFGHGVFGSTSSESPLGGSLIPVLEPGADVCKIMIGHDRLATNLRQTDCL